jgi:hypothetical protein
VENPGKGQQSNGKKASEYVDVEQAFINVSSIRGSGYQAGGFSNWIRHKGVLRLGVAAHTVIFVVSTPLFQEVRVWLPFQIWESNAIIKLPYPTQPFYFVLVNAVLLGHPVEGLWR